MITTDAGLAQTIEVIDNMYQSLCSMHARELPRNRQLFAVMTEGPIDMMRSLEDEASGYIETMLPCLPKRSEKADTPNTPDDCAVIATDEGAGASDQVDWFHIQRSLFLTGRSVPK